MLVPADIAGRVYEPLVRHYRDNPGVQVIVDRRASERHSGEDRRRGDGEPPRGGEERRREMRRSRPRRAPLVRRGPLELPRKVRPYAEQIVFVQRMTPVHSRDEHAETATLVERARRGDVEAANDLYWRHFGDVYRRLAPTLGRGGRASDAAQEVFARAFERLDEPRPGALGGQFFGQWLQEIAHQIADGRRGRHPRVTA